MIKKLLKLEILFVVLSLILMVFSCSDDKDNDKDKELLEGKVNYNGSYYIFQASANMDTSISFLKGNKIQINSNYYQEASTTSTKTRSDDGILQVKSVKPTKKANEYKVGITLVSCKVTLLTQEEVNETNSSEDGILGLKNWQVGVTQDITKQIPSRNKTIIMTFIVSDDKNFITNTEALRENASEPSFNLADYTFIYRQ